MDVILLKKVENLGEMGAVVSVSRGFARNYLLPHGLAVPATDGQRRAVAEHIRLEGHRDVKRKRTAEGLAEKYRDLSCTITVQAGEDDKLFGSVTPRDIASALAEQEVEIEHRQVELEEPIKQLGVYSVPVKLHPEVTITVKVWVVKA
jgi:large subunit ribosomal protein L9